MGKLIIIFAVYLVLYTIFKRMARQAQKQRQPAAPPGPPEQDREDAGGPVSRVAGTGSTVFNQLFGLREAQEELKKKVLAQRQAAIPPPASPPVAPVVPRSAIKSRIPKPPAAKTDGSRIPPYRPLNPATLKEGIILSEILGPCVANRDLLGGNRF